MSHFGKVILTKLHLLKTGNRPATNIAALFITLSVMGDIVLFRHATVGKCTKRQNIIRGLKREVGRATSEPPKHIKVKRINANSLFSGDCQTKTNQPPSRIRGAMYLS